jgi:hypothetical protein
MKIVKTQTLSFNDYSNMVSFTVPPYSKILNVLIEYSTFTIIYEYDTLDEINENKKQFMFRIIKDKDLNFSEFGYEYYKTIIQEDPPQLSNYSNGNQINLSIMAGIKKYFHIFVNEIKSKEELREDKLENILE